MIKFEDIDLGMERIVFLLNAEEGNPGIYVLTWELARFDLTIEDKYRVARQVLTELLEEDLVVLEKFKDLSLKDKIETIGKDKISDILNNPYYWYPCNEILAIDLTQKGVDYLDKELSKYADRISERLRYDTK